MIYRIKTAWKVLRGEWIAHPRIEAPSVWFGPGTYRTTASSSATFNVKSRGSQ